MISAHTSSGVAPFSAKRRPLQNADENTLHSIAKGKTAKTPAASKARRAFGDISNKHNGVESSVSFKSFPKTPSAKGVLVEKTPHSKKASVAPKQASKVDFKIPSKIDDEKDWMLDDIRPAGLTYMQQLAIEADDDTVVSLEGIGDSFKEDFEALQMRRAKERALLHDQEFEKELEAFASTNGTMNAILPSKAHTVRLRNHSLFQC